MNKKTLLVLIALVMQLVVKANVPLEGKWVGFLNNANTFMMVFNMTEEGGVIKATLDVPSQGAKDMPCTSVTLTEEDSVFITIESIKGSFAGKLKEVNKIDGYWTQNGMALQLNLERTEGKIELVRPQTPQPPFSYNSEDIIFYTESKSMYYGATITTPKDNDKHPALILISGSGPQNRDEELFGHKPFAVVADYLTKKGYVVLRIDDRGVGKTGGDRVNTTSADYAEDVKEAIKFLKTRKEVDKKKIGLYGHSEGGMIAEMVAAENKDVDFIILMAAPGVKVTKLMSEQNKAILKSSGIGEEAAESYGKLYDNIVNGIITSSTREDATLKSYKAIDEWRAATDKSTVEMITGIVDTPSRNNFAGKFIEQTWNKWMLYFLRYDPQPVLEKINCKVLALNGDKDIQVVSQLNLEGIRKGLSNGKAKDFETQEIKGVNHLFQECTKCTTPEYGELEQTIKPEVLSIIGDWMDKHVK